MSIPGFQVFMLPILEVMNDHQEYANQEIIRMVMDRLKLSEAERRELRPSSKQSVAENRAQWAIFYLRKAGLIETPRRSVQKITADGRKVVIEKPASINLSYLRRFPLFQQYQALIRPKPGIALEEGEILNSATPEEMLETAYSSLKQNLASELLSKILSCSPQFFEQLVVDLLVAMGYGGSREDAGSAVGRSGDEGIDGIIKEDRLGLDQIYVQAKRWQGGVGRPEIQKFIGALAGRRAKKGVFITTSSFSDEARKYAEGLETKVILIDGAQLAELMIEFNLGVATINQYEVKRIDSDYFSDE